MDTARVETEPPRFEGPLSELGGGARRDIRPGSLPEPGRSEKAYSPARARSASDDGVGAARAAQVYSAAATMSTPLRRPGLEPSREELRISARILLHLSRQPRFDPREAHPPTVTQEGIAKALGATQPAVSNALRRLVDGGAVRVERSHVLRKLARLKVYQLTPHGESLARQIRQSMEG